MGEREDRETGAAKRREAGGEQDSRHPLGYYYDDGTGYEIFNPEEDAESVEEDGPDERSAGEGVGRRGDGGEDRAWIESDDGRGAFQRLQAARRGPGQLDLRQR